MKITATILATIIATTAAFGASFEERLKANAEFAMKNGKATECAAYCAALNSLKQAELAEMQKKKTEAELKFLQRGENIWKTLPLILKGTKSIINMVEPEEKVAHSESSILFKIADVFLKAANTGTVSNADIEDIGSRVKQNEAAIEKEMQKAGER